MTDAFRQAVGFFGAAFAASLLVALACALVGVHVVARRLVTVGVALPQMATLGIACSFWLAGAEVQNASPLRHDAMALAMELVGAAVLAWGARGRALGQDAIAGVLFVGAGALTILVIKESARGLDDVKNLVDGQVLAVSASDLAGLAAALVPVVLVQIVGGRRLIFCTFDRETAATLGVRVGAWDLAFYACLAVTIAAGVYATGSLYVFGFLVLPGAAGILLGRSAAGVTAIAASLALVGAAVGFVLANTSWDPPPGPACVAVELALFVLCAAGARLRTVLGAG